MPCTMPSHQSQGLQNEWGAGCRDLTIAVSCSLCSLAAHAPDVGVVSRFKLSRGHGTTRLGL